MEIVLILLLAGLLLRSVLFWVLSWQIREYRIDRMQSYLRTQDGFLSLISVIFFRGISPRPRITARVGFILFLTFVFALLVGGFFYFSGLGIIWILLILNALVFLLVAAAAGISGLPARWGRLRTYEKAYRIRKDAEKMVSIGITGSYGKSSTKEILVHMMTQHFGAKNILFNPKNNNTEIAIAKLINKNKKFFQENSKRYFIWEVGAYRVGEIETVCDFAMPDYGILTGINAQHIELFGSQKNIIDAKWELAQATNEKIFFNGDSPLLRSQAMHTRDQAEKIEIKMRDVESIKINPDSTEFRFAGVDFVLPWAGEFFVGNALLAIGVATDLGISLEDCSKYIRTLSPLENALHLEKNKNGSNVLFDLYAANPDGVKSAIDHLSGLDGDKYFIGIPLRELGSSGEKVHAEIFQKMQDFQIKCFWLKDDFANIGKEILGENFLGSDMEKLKSVVKNADQKTNFLLESRIPKSVENLFR